jgi:UDP-3-O-[3-hydroxymyristoyl] glucosamine N-acyltransferase
MSMVTKSVTEPGVYSSGMPLETNRLWRKNMVRWRQLEELARRVRELEAKLSDDGHGN